MPRKLSPEEVKALGLEDEAPAPRKLTPEDVRALGLESAGPESIAPEPYGPTAPPDVSAGETFVLRSAGALPAGGFVSDLLGTAVMQGARAAGVGEPGARLTPQAMQELAAMGEDVSQQENTIPGPMDAYRRLRDVRKLRTEVGSEQNPTAAKLGTGFGIGLGVLAPLPGVKFAPLRGIPNAAAAGRAAKVLSGFANGGLYNGLNSATDGNADLSRGEVGQWLGETAAGTAGGAVLGGVLTAGTQIAADKGAAALRELGKRLGKRAVTPSAEATALQDAGVKGMTLGQLNPASQLGQLEGAAQSAKFTGPLIKSQRDVAPASWRTVVLNKVRAPGTEPIPDGADVPEAMATIGNGFRKAYDALRTVAVPTQAADKLLYVVDDPLVLATDAERQTVGKFLQNQMTKLPPSGTTTTVGVMQSIRSDIRDAIQRQLTSNSGSPEVAALLQRAEEQLTAGLDDALPPEAAQALRATDGQYRLFKQLQRAVYQAGDTTDGAGVFSPERLANAVRMETNPTSYVQGGGGPLRALARNAKAAFADPPKTGWGAAAANVFTAPPVWLLNRPAPQAFLRGRAPVDVDGLIPTPETLGKLAALIAGDEEASDSQAVALEEALRRRKDKK